MITPKIYELLDITRFSKSSVIGSYQDEKFDDFNKFFAQPLLPTAVKVHSGDVIDSIEMVYENSSYKNGESPFFHGGPNGYEKLFIIKPGDFLQKIEVEYGKYTFSTDPTQRNKDVIVRIRFTTRSGISSPWYGNECGKRTQLQVKPFVLDVSENNVICCFYGALGKPSLTLHNYLQAIGVYFITFLDLQSAKLSNI